MLGTCFWLPMGVERGAGTTYQPLQGMTIAFSPDESVIMGKEGPAALKPSIRGNFTPLQAQSILAQIESLAIAGGKEASDADPKPANRNPRRRRGRLLPRPQAGGAPAPLTQISPPAPAENLNDLNSTASVGERYELDASKYPLDKEAWSEDVVLKLIGLIRFKDKYILKLSIGNHASADFFVKEIAVREGGLFINSHAFLPLFVGAGHTCEGYVVFDKPNAGAHVTIMLKEDREKGRALQAPINYPF